MHRLLLFPVLLLVAQTAFAQAAARPLVLACAPDNDLFVVLKANGLRPQRFETPSLAISAAKAGSALLLLADAYPTNTLQLSEDLFRKAAEKDIRLYIEFPSFAPGVAFGAPQKTKWERLVISSEQLGPRLPKGRIMMAHESHILQATATNPLLVAARVAGYGTAVYGIPASAQPVLFALEGGRVMVATTKLSGFVKGRFAPRSEWAELWKYLLKELSGSDLARFDWDPMVKATYERHEKLPAKFEKKALRSAANWVHGSRLLVPESRWSTVREVLKGLKPENEVTDAPGAGFPIGDGRFGILEGYSSRIRHNGEQMLRKPIRADCQAESAMVLALDWVVNKQRASKATASNLLDFLYFNSDLCADRRGDPKHPSFGLISWGSITRSWTIANYGDDNARVMLATMLAAACLHSDRWDESLLRALHANLRTTGTLGFQSDRIDMPELERNGWRHYHNAKTVNYSPHFESYNWACYLWAYRQTGEPQFLDRTKTAIQMTMKAFPDKWRWNDSMERARMLLCLAWLVRIENTAEHQAWLRLMVEEVLSVQHETGALAERFRGTGGSHYEIPKSNEAYGTGEAPLIQQNGDPVSDQLYNCGFALLGLHEAAAALDDSRIKAAEDKLAEYLCRIQIRSKAFPYLDGNWFRAFDFDRWEPWASSGDGGWGAWSVEAGWAQAWTAGVLGLRLNNSTLWDMTAKSRIREKLPRVREQMAQNNGEPWRTSSTSRGEKQ